MAFDPASIARRQRERARQRKRQKKLELKQQRRDEKAAKGEEDEGGPQIDWGDAVREGELPAAALPPGMAETLAGEDTPDDTAGEEPASRSS